MEELNQAMLETEIKKGTKDAIIESTIKNVTKRMSAEAAKEQAAAMIDKIAKDYELGKGHLDNENQQPYRDWETIGRAHV